MDIVRETLGSGWGAAVGIVLLLTVAAALVLRRRARWIAVSMLAVGAGAVLSIAVSEARPRVAANQVRIAAEAFLIHGRAAISIGEDAQASEALDQAETRFRAVSAREGIARVDVARGDLARLEGRLEEARIRYASAAARLSQTSQPDASWARLRAGLMEQALEDNDAAHRSFEQAASSFATAGIAAGEAEARLALGGLARRAGAYAEAVRNLRDAARLFASDRRGRGRAILELAWVSQSLRHNEEALSLVAEAETLFADGDARFGLVLTPFVEAEMAIEDEFGVVAFGAIDRAEEVLDGFADPVVAAAAFLGLPPVAVRSRDAFPEYQAEARTLVARARYLIERGRNQADAVQQ